jgi:mannose-1-phosphate guanylyltransferase
MRALLLAAGLSTRLRGLSDERPKPLLPVCNRPLIRWAVAHALAGGIRGFVVNLHHKGELLERELGDGSRLGEGVSVRYSREPVILGTGGGIKQMAGLVERGTLLAMNAKIVADLDLDELLAFHRRRGALATAVLCPDPHAERWGPLGVDGDGRLTRILDGRAPGGAVETLGIFTGVHVLEPEFVDEIPGGPCCVIRTAYAALLARGAPLAGFVHRGYFYDHSTPARYLEGNFNLLAGRAEIPWRPGPTRGVDPAARVHPGAHLEGPILVGAGAIVEDGAVVGPDVVLGDGAVVRAGVSVARSVVWPGAVVAAPVSRAVVTPRGTLAVEEVADPTAAPR